MLAVTALTPVIAGRRKEAVARVRLLPGTGKIVVNGKPLEEYFPRYTWQSIVRQPLLLTQTEGRFDVIATVEGGGLSGQAGALRHGIANALLEVDPKFRPILRTTGLLTRDPRMKERKKYGRKRARKGFQYSKR